MKRIPLAALSLIATAAAALGGLIVVIHYAITAKEPKR